jgi:hypothetical protein
MVHRQDGICLGGCGDDGPDVGTNPTLASLEWGTHFCGDACHISDAEEGYRAVPLFAAGLRCWLGCFVELY